jgi:hypothetical protein
MEPRCEFELANLTKAQAEAILRELAKGGVECDVEVILSDSQDLYFPAGIVFQTLNREEIEGICWKHCQNNIANKTDCFHMQCPLALTEINRRNAIRCNQLRAVAVIAACT